MFFHYVLRVSFASFLLISSLPTFAEVRINELMASNTRSFADITDFEDYPDWIELHNSDSSDAPIGGFFLSDNPARPYKWSIPSGATIPAGGYLLIMADGYDAAIGEIHRRDYWPSRDFSTEKYHSNFSLSSAGESVVLTSVTATETTDLIDLGSVWSYLDDGSSQSTLWRDRLFDDSLWSSGPAPLGYGDEEVTEISYGSDDDNRHITSYFRHHFTVGDPAIFDSLLLSLQVDDSAVIYLNGNEIVRRNLPEGELSSSTEALVATAQPEETYFNDYNLPPDFLISGTNVLAVEVHQISQTSVDMRLDLSLKGIQFTEVSTLDSVTYTQQITDVPLARSPDDPSVWVQLDRSTPGAANEGNAVNDLRATSTVVEISPKGGLYPDAQEVSLGTSAGQIRYTLDGREPQSNDLLYTDSLTIDSPTVIRARVFESGKVPGKIITQTYLIGEEFNGMPVLSITAEPETLFGDDIGIYLNQHEPNVGVGPAVYKGKDAPGHLEFFPNDGSEGFSVNGGIRMGGENNWAAHFQRAMNFVTRGKYGDDELKYDLFPGSKIPIFTALTIREGGDNYTGARLTDPIFDEIAKDRLEVETNKLRAATVFINGEYWGHYNIRDRWDDNWFFQHYGVSDGEYDHMRFESTSGTPTLENGSLDEWLNFHSFIQTNDLNDPGIWAFVESRIDLESFMDFVITESWSNNSSWTGNREIWKPHRAGSKWRWFVPDMDRTFANASGGTLSSMMNREQTLRFLIANDSFKGKLAQRFAAHNASTFKSERIHSIIDELGAVPRQEMNRTSARWGGAPSESTYLSSLESMKSYASSREGNLLAEVMNQLDQDSPILLTLATTGAGSFRIQGVEVPDGQLSVFPNIETTIEALPAPGYRFDCWVGVEGPQETTFNLSQSGGIIAKFVPTNAPALGGELGEDTTLLADTIYAIEEDLIIPSGITLTIPEGVILEMQRNLDIRVMGTLIVNGVEGNEVTIQGRLGHTWGGLSFENPTTTSSLSHVIVRDATQGDDPVVYPSAISGLNATLDLEFLDIGGSRGPLFFRGGSLSLRDSMIDIPLTGDGINVKQGAAETIRCTFTGNNAPDTDAIDYDGVINGIIRDCRIYNFRGFNSDGIDTGEQCVNVLLEGNTLFYNSDKGVSVGQGSSVVMRRNLIVGSLQGVGIKDESSSVLVDQNTFIDCAEGVAVFEKNFGAGGGTAVISNTIFSGCDQPVTVDSLSTVTTSYSLSDTLPLFGTANLNTDPRFLDPLNLDFGLLPDSPGIDTGDPNHPFDPDGSTVDMGAAYTFSPLDFPFQNSNTVVINEILANSGNDEDWIELHNRTNADIDIGGWFLSDDGSDLSKYRIPDGTIIAAGGYHVFFEDLNFGPSSVDPNIVTPFALSNTGETLHLSSAVDNNLTGYRFSEDFGASQVGETIGFYFKPSTGTYNFVRLETPTMGSQNAPPISGPVVISEIMYNVDGDENAEYLELLNITNSTVSLFDNSFNRGWKLDQGIGFEFPIGSSIAPRERIIVTRDATAFSNQFSTPAGTQIFTWTDGALSNSGETIQLEMPGLLDDLMETKFIRIDRVNYGTEVPWTSDADGTGLALLKVSEHSYGNDAANWTALAPSPGTAAVSNTFDDWANGLSESGDEDGDGLSNLIEYALGLDPDSFDPAPGFGFTLRNTSVELSLSLPLDRNDAQVTLQKSPDLINWSPVALPPVRVTATSLEMEASFIRSQKENYYRVFVTRNP